MSKNKKDKKRQHFIPRSYLRAWCDPLTPVGQEPFVWLISSDYSVAQRKSPKKVFYETDFYTVQLDDESRDLDIEDKLCFLEGKFVTARRDILEHHKPIDDETLVIIALFTAATHMRTQARREFMRSQWSQVVELGDRMIAAIENATPEQRKKMNELAYRLPPSDAPTMSHEEVKKIAENPIQETFVTFVDVEARELVKLDLAIIRAPGDESFLTSDNPCVWFDGEARKRSPAWRSPALMFDTIEITLPASPGLMILFNRQGINGYIDADTEIMTKLNVRTIAYADKWFISNRGFIQLRWHPEVQRKFPWLYPIR